MIREVSQKTHMYGGRAIAVSVHSYKGTKKLTDIIIDSHLSHIIPVPISHTGYPETTNATEINRQSQEVNTCLGTTRHG